MSHPGDTARLGDIAEFIRGITFKPDDVVPSGTVGSVRCMRTKNVQANLDLSDVWSVSSSFVKRADQYLQNGDLLVSSANSWNLVGKCCWVPEAASGSTFGGFISTLRPNRERVDPRYLYHWFSSAQTQTTVRSFGRQTTNISNLDFARCLTLPVPLPSLDKQRQIAGVLDSVAALRAKRCEAITLLDDLTQSIFYNMFDRASVKVDRRPLGDICKRITDGTHQSPKWSNTGHPFLFVSNIISGSINFNTSKFISDETYQELTRRCPVEIGDILYSTVGSYGVPAVVEVDRKFSFQRHIAHIKPDPKILNSHFLWAALSSTSVRSQADRAARGVAQKTLNLSEISKFVIPFPSMSDQEGFVYKLKAIKAQQSFFRSHLAQVQALSASIQQRAFRGEL